MIQNVKSEVKNGDFVVSSSIGTDENYNSFMNKFGFTSEKPKRKFNIEAKHSDLGKIIEVDANEKFLLIESSGYARFWKTVESEDEAKRIINDIMEESQKYGYSYFDIGTSIYLCQDLKEYRVTHLD